MREMEPAQQQQPSTQPLPEQAVQPEAGTTSDPAIQNKDAQQHEGAAPGPAEDEAREAFTLVWKSWMEARGEKTTVR